MDKLELIHIGVSLLVLFVTAFLSYVILQVKLMQANNKAELLAAIEFRPWAPNHGWGFAEFARGALTRSTPH